MVFTAIHGVGGVTAPGLLRDLGLPSIVEELCEKEGVYLLNSVNPFRIEGQKAIAFEALQDLGWEPPDWIVLPGGNLGNNSAVGKALLELRELEHGAWRVHLEVPPASASA